MASKFLLLVVLFFAFVCATTSRNLADTKGSFNHQITPFRHLEFGGRISGGIHSNFASAPDGGDGGFGGYGFKGGAGGGFGGGSGIGHGAASGGGGFGGSGGYGGRVGYGIGVIFL
ncbi:hypothetical protein CDL12_01429 [Handroanthus impetiginosus]|uniref:Uncharacterized protein n=1 Tax=Handroanthus impetiginosus TaxID=429701 RepID=A0A2G9I7U7_9LAMI|nr:hypothetical protein CDL12_01429 [Handroanthus impetiginosus]